MGVRYLMLPKLQKVCFFLECGHVVEGKQNGKIKRTLDYVAQNFTTSLKA